MPTNFYRRIPRVVQAMQFKFSPTPKAEQGIFASELEEFCRGYAEAYLDLEIPQIKLRQANGAAMVHPGDWIVRYSPDHFRVFTPDKFTAEFEPFPALQSKADIEIVAGWLQERFDNCMRFADEKTDPTDKAGWLADARYFSRAIELLKEADRA